MKMYHENLIGMHFYPNKIWIEYNLLIYLISLFQHIVEIIGINFDLMMVYA
jgi:hypothetical protein